jgi:hypothetical protein
MALKRTWSIWFKSHCVPASVASRRNNSKLAVEIIFRGKLAGKIFWGEQKVVEWRFRLYLRVCHNKVIKIKEPSTFNFHFE